MSYAYKDMAQTHTKLWKNMVQFIEKIHCVNKKRLMKCCIAALALVVSGYFWNNLQVFTGEDSRMLVTIEHVLNVTLPQMFGMEISRDTTECEDVIFVNTSFDKELIPVHEEDNGTSIGNTDIVNRETLYKFLKVLKDEDVDYKYLVLDIDFSYKSHKKVLDTVAGDSVEIDELLFDLIGSMERVVVAMPISGNLDNRLRRKAALADYTTTIVAPKFVRYKYKDSIPYIPLAVYNSLQKRKGEDTIAGHSLLVDEDLKKQWIHPLIKEPLKSLSVYKQSDNLCYNSLFIPFSLCDNVSIEDCSRNLGCFFSDSLALSIDGTCEGKYVFIGDMKASDMHTTYLGQRPGAYILYKALKELEAGKHQVSLGMMAFLFIVYVWMMYRILSGKNSVAISYLRKIVNLLLKLLRKMKLLRKTKLTPTKNPLLKLLTDMCTFSTVFVGIHIFEYVIYKELYSFTLPIIFFTFLKFYKLMKTSAKTEKCKSLMVIAYAVVATLLFSFMLPPSEKGDLVVLRDAKDVYIVIGDKDVQARRGLEFSRRSIIIFRGKGNEELHVINKGPDFTMKGKIWKHGTANILHRKQRRHIINADWWLVTKPTVTKGADSFAGYHYLAGGFITFPVGEAVSPEESRNRYYVLTCDEGKHKGVSVGLHNSSTDPVVWLFADDLKQKMDLEDSQTYRFKVEKVLFGEREHITDSCYIEYIK